MTIVGRIFEHELGTVLNEHYTSLLGPLVNYIVDKYRIGIIGSVTLQVDSLSFELRGMMLKKVGVKMWKTALEPEIQKIRKVYVEYGDIKKGTYKHIHLGLPRKEEWVKPQQKHLRITYSRE